MLVITNVSFLDIELGFGYYAVIVAVFGFLVFWGKGTRLNIRTFIFVVAAVISIVLNDIPTFFQSEQRLMALVVVMGMVGPLFSSNLLAIYRIRLFRLLFSLLLLTVIASFVGAVLGLNIMTGRSGFTGVYNHSMVMGPMAALSMIYSVYRWNTFRTYTQKWFFLMLTAISFVTCLVAGSRVAIVAGAAGLMFYYYKLNKGNLSRYVITLMFIIAAGIVTFPLWESYTDNVMSKMAYAESKGTVLASRENLWQERIDEFITSPLYGVGFAAVDTQIATKFDADSGIIEPGSSWLAVLSMLGVLGFFPFILIVLKSFMFVLNSPINTSYCAMLGAVLTFFIVHMSAEGYVLSAGAGLSFVFWLVLGVIDSEKREQFIGVEKR